MWQRTLIRFFNSCPLGSTLSLHCCRHTNRIWKPRKRTAKLSVLFMMCIAFWDAAPASHFCSNVTGQSPPLPSPDVAGVLDSRGIQGSLIISGGGKPLVDYHFHIALLLSQEGNGYLSPKVMLIRFSAAPCTGKSAASVRGLGVLG